MSIWQAHASRKLTGEALTTQLGLPSSQAQLTVIAIDPGATLGPHANRAGKTGGPSLALSAPLGAQVWAVGHDADSGAPLIPLNGGKLAEQLRSSQAHAASWVQKASISKAGLMTVGEHARDSKSWSLAAVIVKPGVINARRAQLSAHGSGTEPLPSNNVSALLSADDSSTQRTFTYNAAGDRTAVTANGATVNLGYDQANRLTNMTGGISYSYDGDGLRTSKTVAGTTTQFAWDESGTLPLLLQDGSTYYIYGPDGQPIEQITGSTPTYLLADQQGSTRLLTDTGGNVVGTYSYDPWGNVTSHTGSATTNLQYDEQYTDAETGYQYLRARYYDPTTGQFLTRDPLAALTRSAYGYTADDPLDAVDPTGLDYWSGVNDLANATAGAAAACLVEAPPIGFGLGIVSIGLNGAVALHEVSEGYTAQAFIDVAGISPATSVGEAVGGAILSSAARAFVNTVQQQTGMQEEPIAPGLEQYSVPVGDGLNVFDERGFFGVSQ